MNEKQYALRFVKNRDKEGLPLKVLGNDSDVSKQAHFFKENQEDILAKDFLGEESCEDEYIKFILGKLGVKYVDFLRQCVLFVEKKRNEYEREQKKEEKKEKREKKEEEKNMFIPKPY